MKTRISVLILAIVATLSCNILNDYGNAACAQNPSWCAATGGASTGMAACIIGGATLWECNVVPGSAASLPDPGLVHEHLGACGSFYCATKLADAEGQSGAAGDSRLSCAPIFIADPSWTSCFPANSNGTDAAPPCAELDSPCETGLGDGSLPLCCATTVFVPGSALACGTYYPEVTGTCCIEEGNACTDSEQCCWKDVYETCNDGVCCTADNYECYPGPANNNPVSNNDGCCLNLKCLPDTIGNGFRCQ